MSQRHRVVWCLVVLLLILGLDDQPKASPLNELSSEPETSPPSETSTNRLPNSQSTLNRHRFYILIQSIPIETVKTLLPLSDYHLCGRPHATIPTTKHLFSTCQAFRLLLQTSVIAHQCMKLNPLESDSHYYLGSFCWNHHQSSQYQVSDPEDSMFWQFNISEPLLWKFMAHVFDHESYSMSDIDIQMQLEEWSQSFLNGLNHLEPHHLDSDDNDDLDRPPFLVKHQLFIHLILSQLVLFEHLYLKYQHHLIQCFLIFHF